MMMMMDAFHEAGILQSVLGYLTHRDEKHLSSSSVSLEHLIRNYRTISVCGHAIIQDKPCLPKCFTATTSGYPAPYLFPSLSSYQCASKIYRCYSSQLSYARHLYLKHTKTEAGFGVYSDCTIPKNTLLLFYEGECIRSIEVDKRRSTAEASRTMNYILTINETSITSSDITFKLHYDATYFGNVGRFVNHSCDPNCNIVILRTDSMLGLPAFVSKEVVYRGQQLTIDYGDGDINDTFCDADSNQAITDVGTNVVRIDAKNRKRSAQDIDGEDSCNDSYRDECMDVDIDGVKGAPISKVKCQCKSRSCRGFLPSSTSKMSTQ